jgi:dihydroxyacetone kinase
MTKIFDDPAAFKEDVIVGFSAAYDRYVERVPSASGFVRRGGPSLGKVSIIVGGGSGHYPSYAGIVGRGLADACVLGDVFTSPSAQQIYRVCRAADGGGGLVMAFGNYAGDRLNFAAARERLIADGIDTRIVYVTDDIASASVSERGQRRGIAGTAVVYKIGGAAADSGCDVSEVERIMRLANASTFSYGVAFGGCTLPGRTDPLFVVAAGQMDFGLGIHGEPGVRSAPWMPAAELASELVGALLRERPAGANGQAAVLVNGLGSTKYEELFVLYGHIHRLLRDADVVPSKPEVGEFVTSLDMAGCSLTLTWLDDELSRYWVAPVDTAAMRHGDVSTFPPTAPATWTMVNGAVVQAQVESSAQSVCAATVIRRALAAMRDAIVAQETELGLIDAVAGDGDHGAGMARGLRAAAMVAESTEGGAESVLIAAGDALGDSAGGTSGILWGLFLGAIGTSLGNVESVTVHRLVNAVREGADALQRVGKARLGDKTMLDSLLPFVASFESAAANGMSLAEAWLVASLDAQAAAAATASLVPRVGRARPLAARSIGTPDAGATSMAIILAAVGHILDEAQIEEQA